MPPHAHDSQPYIGRLAPSPTGLLHAGHAATFWTAYDRARQNHGTLLLRNEDLDPLRSKPQFVDAMLEDLHWLGIRWTEPVITQSSRLPLFREALLRLLAAGLVYPCTCSRRDLAAAVQAPHEAEASGVDDEPVYNGRCRTRTLAPSDDPFAHNLRFRIGNSEAVTFHDLAAGPQTFTPGYTPDADFGDFLVWRRDGLPSYQFACVVDDAAMAITEVVRGRDLLKSTARQILLQRALGLPTPAYFHTPLALDPTGRRLAKRHDALSIRSLRQQGLSPANVLARANLASTARHPSTRHPTIEVSHQ